MAIFALVPDNMASIRWVMGAPISMFTPEIILIFSRISARTSSFERLPSIKGASISDVFTPKACSSNSARPVLRPTVCISGTERRIFSAIRPILSDSSSDTPGKVLMLTVNEPSLKGGRKLRPKEESIITARTKTTLIPPNTIFLCKSVHSKALSYPFFNFRTK